MKEKAIAQKEEACLSFSMRKYYGDWEEKHGEGQKSVRCTSVLVPGGAWPSAWPNTANTLSYAKVVAQRPELARKERHTLSRTPFCE